MRVERIYEQVSAILDDYLESLGMQVPRGPLRAAGELIRGILWTGSVQLTNAARLRATNTSRLERTVKRLSRHLGNPRWDHRPWAKAILAQQTSRLQPDDLIAIDATELAKPYARHLQYQCTVRDASRPKAPLVAGYWCWGAYLWQPQQDGLCPLMLCPYSPNQPMFRSENHTWGQYFWSLRQSTAGRGIWLSDRGADRPEVLSAWLSLQPRWIIRLREDRRLIGPDGSVRSAGAWAEWALSNRPERGRAVTLPVFLPPSQVRQFGQPKRLWLVVPTYTFGNDEDRWLLLTCGLIDQHLGPRQVRHDYALRWRSEDAKRFLGQVWHVEQFLTRSYLALERMLWCVVAAGGFLALLQRNEPDLADRLQEQLLYWDKPVRVPAYRIARGLAMAATREVYPAMAKPLGL